MMRLVLAILAAFVAVISGTASAAGPVYGVNLAGGEFGPVPSTRPYGYDYLYPTTADLDLVKRMGGTAVRVPVKAERLQDGPFGPLRPEVAERLWPLADHARALGLAIIFQDHSYGGGSMAWGAPAMADLATKVLAPYKRLTATVRWGWVNEPAYAQGDSWALQQAATLLFRKAGYANRLVVAGAGWDGAHDWVSSGNAARAEAFVDPRNNVEFEAHQYLDADNSGTAGDCVAGSADRVDAALDWAARSGRRLALTELGIQDTPACLAELARLRAKFAAAKNLSGVYFWLFARWAENDRHALGNGAGGPKPLFWKVMGKAVPACP